MNHKEQADHIIEEHFWLHQNAPSYSGPRERWVWAKQHALFDVRRVLALAERISGLNDNLLRCTEDGSYKDAHFEYQYWKQVESLIGQMKFEEWKPRK